MRNWSTEWVKIRNCFLLHQDLFSIGWVGGQKPGTEIQVTGAGWTMLGGQLVQTRLAMYTLTVLYIRTMVLTCEHREVRNQGLRSR